MCLFKYCHSARVCIFLTAFEGLVQILLKPHQPTPLMRADSEHLAIDERSQLRQGSSPRNSFHLSTDQKLSTKLGKALLIRENKQNSGSLQLDTDNICRVFQNSLAHEAQRPKKPGTSNPMMSQVLRLTGGGWKSACEVTPQGKQTCLHE